MEEPLNILLDETISETYAGKFLAAVISLLGREEAISLDFSKELTLTVTLSQDVNGTFNVFALNGWSLMKILEGWLGDEVSRGRQQGARTPGQYGQDYLDVLAGYAGNASESLNTLSRIGERAVNIQDVQAAIESILNEAIPEIRNSLRARLRLGLLPVDRTEDVISMVGLSPADLARKTASEEDLQGHVNNLYEAARQLRMESSITND